ncbi:hypothetical protein C8R44DRAFT_731348 [Mycena epipterygia]|nr:hypothetical protein C8R44DRAFT_731348 [Mycena epipterygia]
MVVAHVRRSCCWHLRKGKGFSAAGNTRVRGERAENFTHGSGKLNTADEHPQDIRAIDPTKHHFVRIYIAQWLVARMAIRDAEPDFFGWSPSILSTVSQLKREVHWHVLLSNSRAGVCTSERKQGEFEHAQKQRKAAPGIKGLRLRYFEPEARANEIRHPDVQADVP